METKGSQDIEENTLSEIIQEKKNKFKSNGRFTLVLGIIMAILTIFFIINFQIDPSTFTTISLFLADLVIFFAFIVFLERTLAHKEDSILIRHLVESSFQHDKTNSKKESMKNKEKLKETGRIIAFSNGMFRMLEEFPYLKNKKGKTKRILQVIGWIVIVLGVLSMFVGVTMAVHQSDIKRLMAYHAISQSGYMLLGIGVGLAVLADPQALASYGREAISGGIFHIINNALYKGLLFLTAEALFFSLGTRDLNKMGGMFRNMRYTAIFFIVGALAISGVPPFNGFTSKLMIYESVYNFSPVLAVIAMLVSIVTLASFTKAFQSAFTGPALPQHDNIREVPKPMLIGMGILAIAIVFFSLFPSLVVNTIVTPATDALIDQAGYIGAVMGGA